MSSLDYVVLVAYFVAMTLIGILSMLKVKKQEDFFLGSRVFGKLFQSFAAFGAGTGSQDPVTIGRTTYTSGLSGIWSVLLWLFVTPFYWFTAVWYRRMRHITMGDWFRERYDSKGLGCAYMIFSLFFYAFWLGVGFTAIGKVGAPLLADAPFVVDNQIVLFGCGLPVEHALVYLCAGIVLIYGVLGGLRAAYWTATVLGELHDRIDHFDQHLFAVSGVSGGSVGASVYRALIGTSGSIECRASDRDARRSGCS